MKFKLGRKVPDWKAVPKPGPESIDGIYVRIEKLKSKHASAIYEAFQEASALDWQYLSYGPFKNYAGFLEWLKLQMKSRDSISRVLLSKPGWDIIGLCSYLNIANDMGSIELGYIQLAPRYQQGIEFTEAVFLMAELIFSLGYRRFEWKCNALNFRSRRAAQRFGFSFEGVFRQALVVKGRNRDTAWFSIIDKEWQALAKVYKVWLSPKNFDVHGKQKKALSKLTKPLLQKVDPSLKNLT